MGVAIGLNKLVSVLTGIFLCKYLARYAAISCVGIHGGCTITITISVVTDFLISVIEGLTQFFIGILVIFIKIVSLSTLQLVASL